MNTSLLVQRIWGLCDTLRDDGVSYGDYLQQLTFLLFLKMVDEVPNGDSSEGRIVPDELGWRSLRGLDGTPLKTRYEANIHALGKHIGVLGAIFDRAQSRIEDPHKLRHLVDLIDAEHWLNINEDVKGDMYEGLLQKNAEDVKSGAGQYFTPRPLIQAIVECVRPEPMRTIADPACGTGGFLLGAHQWLKESYPGLTHRELDFLSKKTFSGNEIVADTRRLALMNLMLHGIGGLGAKPLISRSDALATAPSERVDYVFANPPFGKKSSFSSRSRHVAVETRQDIWVSTGSKQLDFLQHIFAMLKTGGEAAVVLPDNVLFEGGTAERVRRELLRQADVHTLLRLPSGLFYAGGVQANVLFFRRVEVDSAPSTERVWVYDFRTGARFTRVRSPLERHHLDDFVQAYSPSDRGARRESARFRSFSYEEVTSRPGVNMDLGWVDGADSDGGLHDAERLRAEIIHHLRLAAEAFERMELRVDG